MSITKDLAIKYPEAVAWMNHHQLNLTVVEDMEDHFFKMAIVSNKENETEDNILKIISQLLPNAKSA